MIDFTVDTHIDRPVEEVFAYSTDPDRLATWQTNTVSAVREDEGPLRVGSRIREVHRTPRGKELASTVEVSEYESPRAFALTVVEGIPIHARMTFEPSGDGSATLMRFNAHGRLGGALRLAQPLIQRVLKRQFAEQCATLKRVLESEAPAAAGAEATATAKATAKATAAA